MVARRTDLIQTAWTQAVFPGRSPLYQHGKNSNSSCSNEDGGTVCYKACSPHGNKQILHRHEHENETLFHLSITEKHLTRFKREIKRIILILNLCLQVCKDKCALSFHSDLQQRRSVSSSDSISLASKPHESFSLVLFLSPQPRFQFVKRKLNLLLSAM